MSKKGPESGAAVYAEALAAAAEAKGVLEQVGDELIQFAGDPRPEAAMVRQFFACAAIRREEKMAKIESAFRGRATDLTTDFLLVLLGRNRQELLRPVALAYKAILDQRSRRVPVTITTAAPASPEDLAQWKDRLRAAIGKEPVVSHKVKPSLIGGVVLRIGDVVADGSVRHKLDQIRSRVAAAGHPSQAT